MCHWLVGGLVAINFMFPYIGNHHFNGLSYFSEGFKPPTRLSWSITIVEVYGLCISIVCMRLKSETAPPLCVICSKIQGNIGDSSVTQNIREDLTSILVDEHLSTIKNQ